MKLQYLRIISFLCSWDLVSNFKRNGLLISEVVYAISQCRTDLDAFISRIGVLGPEGFLSGHLDLKDFFVVHVTLLCCTIENQEMSSSFEGNGGQLFMIIRYTQDFANSVELGLGNKFILHPP